MKTQKNYETPSETASTVYIKRYELLRFPLYFFQPRLRENQLCSILVDFAVQLMTLIERINMDSFQRFELRAGLNQVN